MKIYSYNMQSASAKALSKALGVKRIRHHGPYREIPLLLNWGASVIHRGLALGKVINSAPAISIAANKLSAFKALSGYVTLPDWTESREEAAGWLLEGSTVVARTVLNGHSGNGIIIYKGDDEKVFDEAPLYTKYVAKQEEYRLHVCNGNVFFVQRKARKLDVPQEEVNWQIRNHQNGFIYANKDVIVSDKMKEQALTAVEILGLDFGAVDIIVSKRGDAYVLEVNTAPGLSGTTLDKYVEQFKGYL